MGLNLQVDHVQENDNLGDLEPFQRLHQDPISDFSKDVRVPLTHATAHAACSQLAMAKRNPTPWTRVA